MTYKVESIRKERPQQISVRHGLRGPLEVAEIRGWLLDFPLVCFGDGMRTEVQVSVETLVHLLNTNQPLLIL